MTYLLWLAYILALAGILLGALYLSYRMPRVISFRVALAWAAFWALLTLAFSFVIHHVYDHRVWGFGLEAGLPETGAQAMGAFLTAYAIETCLNLDNVFAAALIFAHFRIPLRLQYRVLFWGVIAAIAVRGVLIGLGAQLFQSFEGFHYVLAIILIGSAIRLMLLRFRPSPPEQRLLVRAATRLLPLSTGASAGQFFARVQGRLTITPLFAALLLIESSDLVFAFDSIAASFAITRDPFLVFTANTFAMLGMRALYFALVGIIDRFHYLRASLVALLLFLSAKMLAFDAMPLSLPHTISGLVLIMATGLLLSMRSKRRPPEALVGAYAQDIEEYARFTWRQARKVIVLMVGGTVIVIGVAMLLLPGPAFIVIPMGLAMLATEFVWARRLIQRLKQDAGGFISYVRHFRSGDRSAEEKPRTEARPIEK